MLQAMLLPVDGGVAVELRTSEPTTLGRGAGQIFDAKFSREHLRFTPTDGVASFALEVIGANGCETIVSGTTNRLATGGCAVLAANDEVYLLPGKHRYRLEINSTPHDDQLPAKRVCTEERPSTSTAAAATAAPGADWSSLTLCPFAQPPKPTVPGGLRALEALAFAPGDKPATVLLVTDELVLAYDLYPKARVHLLVLPRRRLAGVAELRRADAPLLASMAALAGWAARELRRQMPALAPLRAGFHAVPSMWQLHLHLISLDLDSACLKHKKHFNSFSTPFFVPVAEALADLEGPAGLVRLAQPGCAAAAAALEKGEMRCPLTFYI